jgi:L-fuconolactonase
MIDSHHHLWKYVPQDFPWITGDFQKLDRHFLLGDVKPFMKENDVSGLVTVQACQTLQETEWLLQLASEHSEILGVVGWVPLADKSVEEALAGLSVHPKLKGIRHLLQDEPDPAYMLRSDFNCGVRHLRKFGLAYDILISDHQIQHAQTFVRQHPDQVFVLDHIGNPQIREQVFRPWRESMHGMAECPNVYCKISGMVTQASWEDWTESDLNPYFDAVLELFGPKRLMFGSDWPVLTLACDYSRWINVLRRVISKLTPDEQAWITHRTAATAYQIR